jgi:hypothetical protein
MKEMAITFYPKNERLHNQLANENQGWYLVLTNRLLLRLKAMACSLQLDCQLEC